MGVSMAATVIESMFPNVSELPAKEMVTPAIKNLVNTEATAAIENLSLSFKTRTSTNSEQPQP